MSKNARGSHRDTPHPQPVTKIELNERYAQIRFAVVLLLLAIGVTALVYGAVSALGTDSGWREIEVDSSAGAIGAEEFVFQYNLGASGAGASAEYRAVKALYTDAQIRCGQLYDTGQSAEGVVNLYEINRHPNEELTVDPLLYQTLARMAEDGGRLLYLGPIYEEYTNLFLCAEDYETVDYDPRQSDAVFEYVAKVLSFANDAEHIRLCLLGDDRVCLSVSREYLDFAEAMGIVSFLDLGWMKNAFVADYIAETLTQAGYTRGTISSYDGFVRTLDDSGEEYSFNLFHREESKVRMIGKMVYREPRSIVYLRDYPMNSLDVLHYRTFENGEVRTVYIDPEDGFDKTAVSELVVYSSKTGCADMALFVAPVYIADEFVPNRLEELRDSSEMFGIYYENGQLCSNDPNLTVSDQ